MNLPEFLTNPDPEQIYSGNYVCLDFETTNLDMGSPLNIDNRIVLACWYSSKTDKMYHAWGGELDQYALVRACNEADFLIAHNAKFECGWLDRCGFDTASKPWWDTYSSEWVLAGNRPWRLNLDACLARRNLGNKVDTVSQLIKGGICPSEIPKSMLLRYGGDDVRLTKELYETQRKEMEGTSLLPVAFTRGLAAPVLADIEASGMYLDSERVEEVYKETLNDFMHVSRELEILTGGINPRSPKQVAEFVYGELGFKEKKFKGEYIRNKPTKAFPDGAPKTDEATLLSLEVTTPQQEQFIVLKKQYAKLASALDKNLSLFVGVTREKGGMLYGELNQGRTATHRLSSAGKRVVFDMFDKPKGCQFQNLPRIYKRLFSARREDWYLAEADGSQLEYRVAGHLGDEDVIRKEIKEGYDVHLFTASELNVCPVEAVTGAMRTDAKADTFKPLYGGESGTEAQQRYYRAFRDKLANLTRTQEEWCNDVGNNKVLETEWGLKYYWPNARFGWGGRLNVKTSVYNYPIQAFATAEIIPIALVYFWHRARAAGMELLIINTIHDSIIVELPEKEIELFGKLVVQSLTEDVYEYLNKVYNIQFSVPLGVGIKIGNNWSESAFTDEELVKYCDNMIPSHAYSVDDGEITVTVNTEETK
jgi:DNA polymerase I-like protein with 3'-5' exonuclease and polymerase domains